MPCSTPGVLDVVVGVNHHRFDPAQHRIVSAASCTTNCFAPVVKVIHEGIGIRHGSLTTIHSLTNTQVIVDAPHKDLRRARACGSSLIPTSTGSATAIAEIFPELKGRLNGHAVRVPLTNASLTDCVFEVERATDAAEVNQLLKAAAEGELKGILGYEERPLVSIDYRTDPRSSIIDALSTMVVNGTQVKIYAWYDNEWGYANRTVELARLVGSGAEQRDGQRDYARAAASAFAPRDASGAPQMILAEAGTGIGKTLGYLAPAALWAREAQGTVWVATFTKALQRQLDAETARVWPDPAERRAKVVVRKGRENYLCLLNLEDAVQGGFGGRAAVFARLAREESVEPRIGQTTQQPSHALHLPRYDAVARLRRDGLDAFSRFSRRPRGQAFDAQGKCRTTAFWFPAIV